MILFAVYSNRVAVGYSRNLRKAKDTAHKKDADEILQLRIPDVKGELHIDVVRRWKRKRFSTFFIPAVV